MNNIKVNFSIKDLENLTGIKAHTIRIWEKRYNLLSPNRTDTNIRTYSIESLQKLLNISYLNNNGLKISKIAELKEEDIPEKVKEIASIGKTEDHAVNTFKLAMFNFNQTLFNTTYNSLLESKTFSDIFYTVFLPLLNHIGVLWQTNTITPAHEHFISVLIKQKILLNIENTQNLTPKPNTKTYVLFLPEHEIHDIGLLFINYQLRSKGYHTVFLGESVPMNNLKDLFNFFNDISFISYFTIYPEEEKITAYLDEFNNLLLENNHASLILLGHKLTNYSNNKLPKNISIYKSIENLVKDL
ncbi:MerR family transcriptional regulator [Mariniflexile sp. HNIBRBA6329]|uniref:MerR family transcriptional regulator n=1 Tax=Mariniflexile sp. HNIBRBA6329 TaxID=3373088 RepID=UPI003744B68E